MTNDTLKALLESIVHWDLVAQGLDDSVGMPSCALCRRFFTNSSGCDECPIKKRTGRNFCKTTPCDGLSLGILRTRDRSQTDQDAIEEMVEFLISLLPAHEAGRYDLSKFEKVKTFEDLKFGDGIWVDGKKSLFIGTDSANYIWFGRLYENGSFKDVAWTRDRSDISLTPPKPQRPDFKVGQPVWVWDHPKSRKYRRSFASWSKKSNKILTGVMWSGPGQTWKYYRLPTNEELTAAGIDPSDWMTSD